MNDGIITPLRAKTNHFGSETDTHGHNEHIGISVLRLFRGVSVSLSSLLAHSRRRTETRRESNKSPVQSGRILLTARSPLP